jgi:Transposase DDE domain
VNGRPSFQALTRVFSENCEVTGTAMAVVQPKAADENGQSSRVMQNPSDLDAGYDGHKGPGIIAACLPQSAAESDGGSLAPVQEQQQRMGTLPELQLSDTSYGSHANVEMSAGIGVKLVSPAAGTVEKTLVATQARGISLTPAQEKKIALDQRRAEQETPEWKQTYAKRSGVEGVHEALDRKTGIKKLRVRGRKAVAMAVFLKVTGWNICAAAKIALNRRKKAGKEAAQKKTTGMAPELRRLPEDLGRRQTSTLLPPRFSRRQRGDIFKVSRSVSCRQFVFAPASDYSLGIPIYARFSYSSRFSSHRNGHVMAGFCFRYGLFQFKVRWGHCRINHRTCKFPVLTGFCRRMDEASTEHRFFPTKPFQFPYRCYPLNFDNRVVLDCGIFSFSLDEAPSIRF